MSESYAEFHDRLAKIYRQQAKTGRVGRKAVAIDRNGYVIVKGKANRRSFPWSGLMMVAVAFFAIKGIMIAQFGPDFYSQHVARMADASAAEQVMSWTMSPDPVSRWVATQVKSVF
ncbi:hypothetical protein BXY66_0716 [Shimia isoporae]|uniref:Uncharacterized protein n=1 Tax=Shimia isoporae TaxID=647720 RepID=A0A4R1NTS4_9RHOB|nr:hypothetical protein [Shimia isoporae]TCL08678.1 hypothetical protein BXY66_0716 [Shimia isoporae]